jgi:hypothetical protein
MDLQYVTLTWESEVHKKIKYKYDDGAVVFRGQAMGKPIAAAYKSVADAGDPKPEIKEHLKQILSERVLK